MEKTSSYDMFLEYRAAVIQAIAKAWGDPTFYRELVDDPILAMSTHLNYDFPFNMDLCVIENSGSWEPEKNQGWILQQDGENFVDIVLPPKPEEEDQQTVALAKYGANHINFLPEK